MRTRLLLVLAIAALTVGTLTPGVTKPKMKTYTRTYAAPSTPGVSFKINLADVNLGEENLADEDPTGSAKGSPLDMQPFKGTPLDMTPLKGTPADTGIGGVFFAADSYKGTPFSINVVDTTGTPVRWSACQRNGPNPVCGLNSNDLSTDGCGVARLSGWKGGDIDIWVVLNDSAGLYGSTCDGVATTGTVVLTTKIGK